MYSQSLVSHPSALGGEDCTAASQHPRHLPAHWVPSLPLSVWPEGSCQPPRGGGGCSGLGQMHECKGHLLPECRAWEIIYLVSYDSVFPCVNIWEARLIFCAQLRQLQPSAQLCTPGPLTEISPAMSLPHAKGETLIKPPQRNTASSAHSPQQPHSGPLGLDVLLGQPHMGQLC